jgi:hypothetical protein
VKSTFNNRKWELKSDLDYRSGSALYAINSRSFGDCAGDDESGVMYAKSPTVTVPAALPNQLQVTFIHYYSTEAGYDGGVIYLIKNGGTATPIPKSTMTFNPYPNALQISGNTNPLKGLDSYTGYMSNAGYEKNET